MYIMNRGTISFAVYGQAEMAVGKYPSTLLL